MGGRGSSGGSGGGRWAMNLPQLSGTEKQVAWAEQIRSGAYSTLDEIESALKNGEDWVVINRTSKDGRTFVEAEIRVIGSRGPKVDARDISSMRTSFTSYFTSDAGRKAENIIDMRQKFSPKNIGVEIVVANRKRKKP